MANVDAPSGMRLVGHLHGKTPSSREYYIPSTDSTIVGIGEPVELAGGADSRGTSTVKRYTAGNALLGVVLSVDQVGHTPDEVSDANFSLYRKHRPASVGMYVTVCDDPHAIFAIQDDNSTTMAAADIGLNADLITAADADTTTGVSKAELDSSSKATTATLQLKILGLVDKADNALGANNELLVKINNHQFGSHTGTAGV